MVAGRAGNGPQPGVTAFVACATAHAPPNWSSRHRRPTHRGAGQAPRVKVERPAGRTTLARGAWSARLVLGRRRRDGQASTSATRQPRPGGRRPSWSPRSPPEAGIDVPLCSGQELTRPLDLNQTSLFPGGRPALPDGLADRSQGRSELAMASALIQISAVVSCAGIALRYVIQFIVVIWSLKADEDGRQHALRLLLVLRVERPRRRLPSGGFRTEHPPGRRGPPELSSSVAAIIRACRAATGRPGRAARPARVRRARRRGAPSP